MGKRMATKIILILATILLLALAGCNTVKGVGKDIHDTAQVTQNWIEGTPQ